MMALVACGGISTAGLETGSLDPQREIGDKGGRPIVDASLRPPNALPPSMQRLISTASEPLEGFVGLDAGGSGTKGFFSDYNNNAVYVYSAVAKLVATLTGFNGPQGIATDAAGNLYVADTLNNRVQLYSPPYNGTPITLDDSGEFPIDPAVDPNGNVAVANQTSTSGGSGSVSFYAKGATTVANNVIGGAFAEVFFCGFDAKGNLYLDGIDAGGITHVGEVIGGIAGTGIKSLKTGNTVGFPGGVQVTTAGLISVDDQTGASIYNYSAPNHGSLGNPVSTTSLKGAMDPVSIAFTPQNTAVFIADAGLDAANEYRFPVGGSPTKTLAFPSGALPVGVAVTPTESF